MMSLVQPSVIELYNPLDPNLIADPYATYRRMRETQPIYYSTALNAWMFSRYRDVNQVLKDKRMAAGTPRVAAMFANFAPEKKEALSSLQNQFVSWSLFQDPPNHTSVRNVLNSVFSALKPEMVAPNVQSVVDEIIHPIREGSEIDFMRDIAYPLPVLVIGRLLGLPDSDRELLKRWSDDIAGFMARLKRTYEIALKAQTAIQELSEYCTALLLERRTNPKDDIISLLAQERSFSDEVAAGTCAMLLFAGHETTTNLIGNGYWALVNHPTQLNLLRTQRTLIPTAIEEMLRWDSPVQFLVRISTEPIEFSGIQIPEGKRIINFIGSANRDEQEFPGADLFDITRTPNRHLSFGQGLHFCIGAGLARLEGKLLFSALLEKFQNWEITSNQFSYRQDLGFRGMTSLPARLS